MLSPAYRNVFLEADDAITVPKNVFSEVNKLLQ
jgi:hypothetical protein